MRAALRDGALPLLVLGLLAAAPFIGFGQGHSMTLLARAMILAMAAVSLSLLVGGAGLISLGHAAMLGFGAYAVVVLDAAGITEAAIVAPVAMAAAAGFALLTGAVAIRTSGVNFIMITLAFGQMLFFLASALADYGGDDGMTLASRSLVAGSDLLTGDAAFYWTSLAFLAAAYGLSRAIVASRFGRVLRGIRENAVRMEAIGFQPFRYQLTAYAISGMLAGLAGFLMANQAEFVSPAFMTWQRSGELIFMVVLGGLGTLHGAIIGAAAFLLLEEFLPQILDTAGFMLADDVRSRLVENWKMVFGPILILVVLFARGGIARLLRRGPHD